MDALWAGQGNSDLRQLTPCNARLKLKDSGQFDGVFSGCEICTAD